ncbi:class I SAM-dependent methyltransferase [Clostridium sp. DJ247]|uniref:class I SAM-dependent methyltransferase n=1 Tax=Clostridium sp. DJ247 TaxID=2726188 RepID=UPI0016249120|nr:class I SAM-dependent methyltransferase [Clostridium sp. DJ247]MBC2580101.1 class I SAM-dependent methyltransferase [Clostridium sp. DJ247]
MEKEIFRGNILDIGLENYGVIYSIYKQYNEDVNIEYINGRQEEDNIKENFYDNCILLFSFSSIWFALNKKNFIKDIYKYLAKDGLLYIWDIDKGYGKIFDARIKIVVPGNNLKEIKVRDLNILKNNSKEKTMNLLQNYFEVLDVKSSDGMFYIKAKKKLAEKAITKEKKKEKIFKLNSKGSVNSA